MKDFIVKLYLIIIPLVIMLKIYFFFYPPSEQSEEDKKFWAIVDYRDSLQQINYREYNTIIPGLDLRSSPDNFKAVIKKHKKSGVLADVKERYIFRNFSDSLRTGFRLTMIP